MEHPKDKRQDEADSTGLLLDFGLTRLEATVYVELLQSGDLNGYELAKSLNISRSNAYTALAGLTDKGAAWSLEGAATRYTAVSPKEFLSARLKRLDDSRKKLLASLPKRREACGGYITIKGADNILSRLLELLSEAQERLYLALPSDLLMTCLPRVLQCVAEGRKVVIITDRAEANAKKIRELEAATTVYKANVQPYSVRVIVDSNFVLTGSVAEGKDATCLYSNHKNLVDLFKSALRNEIKLIELGLQNSEK
jgi:sugar-specific transcriptional regulator TrmB